MKHHYILAALISNLALGSTLYAPVPLKDKEGNLISSRAGLPIKDTFSEINHELVDLMASTSPHITMTPFGVAIKRSESDIVKQHLFNAGFHELAIRYFNYCLGDETLTVEDLEFISSVSAGQERIEDEARLMEGIEQFVELMRLQNPSYYEKRQK